MMRRGLCFAAGFCLLLAAAGVTMGCGDFNNQNWIVRLRGDDGAVIAGAQHQGESPQETPVIKAIDTDITDSIVVFNPIVENVDERQASFYWSFGDGQSSDEKKPMHRYKSSGKYTVSLTVANRNGKESTYSISVTIKNTIPEGPVADFSCVDNQDGTVTCTASVTGATAYRYSWNTNDEVGVSGETARLKLLGGKQNITLYVDIDGSWTNPLIVTKTVNVGVAHTDRVFLFTKDKTEPQYMYFAVKVKGTSPTGLFRQEVGGEYAYARDLHVQVSTPVATIGGVPTKYSNFNGKDVMTLCTNYNVCVTGYNAKTGFATEDGKSFVFPFYYGDDNFRVLRNSGNTLNFAFEAFVIRDTTKAGLLPGLGNPSLASIHGSKKLTLSIPMQDFDENRHRNIALFTIDFENYEKGTEFPKVIFDGFVGK